jgi:predicted nucleic acid-binding protein
MLLDSNVLIYACSADHAEIRDFIRDTHPSVSIISTVETLGYHSITNEDERLLDAMFSVILNANDLFWDRRINNVPRQKIANPTSSFGFGMMPVWA